MIRKNISSNLKESFPVAIIAKNEGGVKGVAEGKIVDEEMSIS